MARYTLIISLAVLVFNFQVFGATWYIENFDKFKNGDILGQDGWEVVMNQKTSRIQGKVKHGDVGKSVLVSEKTMVLRKFKGSNASIQYVSLFVRKDDGSGPFCPVSRYAQLGSSQCLNTEYPVVLEIEPTTKNLAGTASLHLGCYAPDLIELITANSFPPPITIHHGGPNPGNCSLLLYFNMAYSPARI